MPLDEAYRFVASDDKRPLLILRECELCKGTDHALLARDLDNDTTTLLASWFHCVKLPPNVLGKEHPLYALFERAKEGERIPHLFFCDFDGGNKQPLPGNQTQAELWETMFSFLERDYQGDAKKAVKELRSLLAQFDMLDNKEQELKARMDREIEKHGPDSDKLKKFDAEIAAIGKERQGLFDREKRIRALALKDLNAPAGGKGEKAPAPAPAPAVGPAGK